MTFYLKLLQPQLTPPYCPLQLLEDLESKLSPERLEDIELQSLIDGFAAVSRNGATAICNIIFQVRGSLLQRLILRRACV